MQPNAAAPIVVVSKTSRKETAYWSILGVVVVVFFSLILQSWRETVLIIDANTVSSVDAPHRIAAEKLGDMVRDGL